MKSFVIAFFFTLIIIKAQGVVPIVPEPQQYNYTDSRFVLNDKPIAVNLYIEDNEPLLNITKDLIEKLKTGNLEIKQKAKLEKIIHIGIPSLNPTFEKLCTSAGMKIDNSISPEGYQLLIKSDLIIISSNDPKGLFYGIQSLKQLINGSVDNYLQGIEIKDYPSFKLRGIMDDISRGPIPTMDYMKSQIRKFSELKLNFMIHYVEHVVKTKKHPKIAPDDGSYTIEEWKEITEYANLYNIELVGSFQSFGHFEKILSIPEYAHLGESGTLISPVKEESYVFLNDIYTEMIPEFSKLFFSVGLDETFDLGKEESKKLVDSLGYAEVYYRHIMRLYDILKKKNTRMSMWGDILLEHPELLERIPKDILIGTWNYDPQDDFLKLIVPIKNAGLEFIVCPGVLNSNKILPQFGRTITNINNFTRDGLANNALGVLNCIWDDAGTALFNNDWYGVAYGAEQSWNCTHKNIDEYDFRFNRGVLGASNDSYTTTIHKLNELEKFELTDGMTDKILWNKLVPQKGESLKISKIDLDSVLSVIDEAQMELNKIKLNSDYDLKAYLQFVIDIYLSEANKRIDLIKIAANYKDALKIVFTEPFEAREKMVEGVSLINRIIERQNKIIDSFSYLWLIENHTYALSRITNKYENESLDYERIKNDLYTSLKMFDTDRTINPLQNTSLNISELPGKYFREWMIIDPIYNLSDFNGDLLEGMGGEKTADPKVTQEFYIDSVKYRWRRLVSDYPDVVDISKIFNTKDDKGVVYSFANIFSDTVVSVNALVGTDEMCEIFINGDKVATVNGGGSFIPDGNKISIPLIKGKNNLLIKNYQTKGEWAFSFRLPEIKVRNSKNRYTIYLN
ncbi:MAG: beta-N-acetylhexosaminidase [Melioribacteraceae bacterium]|nr:beta-N-acetylhexosaminidase [Melioribacteraceae bacterium]